MTPPIINLSYSFTSSFASPVLSTNHLTCFFLVSFTIFSSYLLSRYRIMTFSISEVSLLQIFDGSSVCIQYSRHTCFFKHLHYILCVSSTPFYTSSTRLVYLLYLPITCFNIMPQSSTPMLFFTHLLHQSSSTIIFFNHLHPFACLPAPIFPSSPLIFPPSPRPPSSSFPNTLAPPSLSPLPPPFPYKPQYTPIPLFNPHILLLLPLPKSQNTPPTSNRAE